MPDTLNYRDKRQDPSWLQRHHIARTLTLGLRFLLRLLAVAASFYFVFIWPNNQSLNLGGHRYLQWRSQGLLLIALDPAYGTPGNFHNDFIASILASTTSSRWPYANWILFPAPLIEASYLLGTAAFWYLTRPRKRKAENPD
jgi:hypothetical protein